MAWQELKPPVDRPTSGVKIGRTKSRGAFLSINAALADEAGIKPGMTFRVSLGHAEAAGQIRLEQEEGKGFIAHTAAWKSIRIRLGDLPAMPDDLKKARPCDFELVSKKPVKLSVKLPWETEESPQTKPRGVTAGVLGDPNFGRKA